MKRIFSKKTIALLLATAMTGSLLSGCGSGGSGGNGGSSAGRNEEVAAQAGGESSKGG